MKNQSRQENIIYLVVWGILFAAPLLSLYVRTVSDPGITFDWKEILMVWRRFTIYLFLFLLHNFLLAPLLVHHRRHRLYFSIVAIMIVVFVIYQCGSRPNFKEHIERRPPPPMEHNGGRPPLFGNHPPKMEQIAPRERRPDMPPPFVGEHDILALVILVLMLGANLGAKFYFRNRNDHKRLMELEKQNLEQQLEYLRYQVNPHFFMNTLNNIHALVDIDPAKAQETIRELSKMMRFVLYEGDKRGVSLASEFDFVTTYIKLMKLRYTDKVKISMELPEKWPNKTIPPLILISFIENAFKHGISYQQPSFIEVKADVEQQSMDNPLSKKNDEILRFRCCNSKANKPNEEKGGVGLTNVKKRLDLIYGQNYSLLMQNDADTYTVELIIPLI